MTLPSDWSEFIAGLIAQRVRFLIVGAHALAASGRPRATQDLDVLVEPTAENAARLGQALHDFGFPSLAAQCQGFAEADRMATLGNPPLRIDILTSLAGVSFEQAWAGRLEARFGDHFVGFLGRTELILNKRPTRSSSDPPGLRGCPVYRGRSISESKHLSRAATAPASHSGPWLKS